MGHEMDTCKRDFHFATFSRRNRDGVLRRYNRISYFLNGLGSFSLSPVSSKLVKESAVVRVLCSPVDKKM